MKNSFYQRFQTKSEPYIIAEIGSNHNGDMELARKLIRAAKDAGANCVKFQSWTKDTIFSKTVYKNNYFLKDDYRERDDYSLEEIVEKFSISEKELMEMKAYADEIGIDCISTPFSRREVDFLTDDLKVPFIKIASMDVNNYPFLEYVAKKDLPVVISTGLSELHEIDRAIRTIENAGNTRIVILHCVSIYPPKDEQVNLRNMESLRQIYPYPIGFSDHTLGYSIPLAAVALGAQVIEKHFTLDKNMFGWDHKVSATPDELKIICDESGRIYHSLGTRRIICEEDAERKAAFRRSIVTTTELKAGTVIAANHLDAKRPGTGIPPGDVFHVIGRTMKRDVAADEILKWEDLV